MPQTLTFSVSAKFDKGPELKSEAKVDVGTYAGAIEEQVCKCSGTVPVVLPDVKHDQIEMLIISSDKYSAEKDCIPSNGSANGHAKSIKWGLTDKPTTELNRPLVISGDNLTGSVGTIYFQNDLTIDVKVSVLVILKKKPAANGSNKSPPDKTHAPTAN